MLFSIIACLLGATGSVVLFWHHGVLAVLCAAPLAASLLTFLMGVMCALVRENVPTPRLERSVERPVVRLVVH